MHSITKYTTYILLIVASCASAYTFKPVTAQAQKSRPTRGAIGSVMSMNALKMIAPTRDSSLVSVNQAYFVNNQWYSAIFMYVKTDTRPANGSRVYLTVTGVPGAWNVYKFGLDWSDVFGLPTLLRSDSVRLDGEITRAKAAEALLQPKGAYLTSESDPAYISSGATRSYANSLSLRIANDSSALITERNRAIAAEAGKLSVESDPLYTTNGVPKTRTVNGKALSTDIALTKADVGLANADNTSDIAKPVSTLQQAALDLKESVSNKVSSYTVANASTTQYITPSYVQGALVGVVKGVQLGGGSATFTTTSLLANGTTTVTIPLNTTYADLTYQVTTPTVIGSGGVNLLGNLTIASITKNLTNVVVVLRNTALLAVAVSGTIDVVTIRVN